MTALELHIDLEQKLQNINANRFSNLLTEEKDWWLSEAQMRFIKRRISPKINSKKEGNQQTTKRYDDLQALIETYQSNLFTKDGDTVFAPLPFNYYELLNSRTTFDYNCNSTSLATDVKSYYISTIKLSEETAANIPVGEYYKGLQLSNPLGGTPLFNLTTDVMQDGFLNYSDSFVLREYLLNRLNNVNDNIQVYWERYDDKYYPDSFVFIIQEAAVTPTVPTDIVVTTANGLSTTHLFTLVSTRNMYVSNPTNNKVLTKPNRLVQTEFLYDILEHSFFTTSYKSPVIDIAKNLVNVHHNKTFQPTSIVMDYYRVPRRVRLQTEQSFEVASPHHSEIVDIAVQIITAHNMNPNYQAIANENFINE